MQLRIQAVQRDTEQDRQLALERRGVEDGEIGTGRVGDRPADPLQKPRPFQHLLGERPRRGVMRAQHGEAGAGVRGGDAGQQVQVGTRESRGEPAER